MFCVRVPAKNIKSNLLATEIFGEDSWSENFMQKITSKIDQTDAVITTVMKLMSNTHLRSHSTVWQS